MLGQRAQQLAARVLLHRPAVATAAVTTAAAAVTIAAATVTNAAASGAVCPRRRLLGAVSDGHHVPVGGDAVHPIREYQRRPRGLHCERSDVLGALLRHGHG